MTIQREEKLIIQITRNMSGEINMKEYIIDITDRFVNELFDMRSDPDKVLPLIAELGVLRYERQSHKVIR